MNHSNLSQEFFTQQLAYIEENIQDLTSLYDSSTPIQDRIKLFFNSYVLEVEDFLSKKTNQNYFSSFPKVLIGTKVTVLYDEENDSEEYVICFPNHSDPDKGYISFLSPVGRQLLLRKLGEKISLKIPTGDLRITIQNISYFGDMFEMEDLYKEA